MLNRYPDNLSLNVVEPLTIDRTRTIFEWYAPEGMDAASLTPALELGEATQQEDIALCESVQRRLGSVAYDRGRFSPRRERGVHHFQSLVHEFLTTDNPGTIPH